jgi:hypothetical protein
MAKDQERGLRQSDAGGLGTVAGDPEVSPPLVTQRPATGTGSGPFGESHVAPRANAEFFRGLARERQAKRWINASICLGEVPAFLVGGASGGDPGRCPPPGEPPDPEDRPSSSVYQPRTKRLGLNHLRAYRVDALGRPARKYCPDGAQVADAGCLGAGLGPRFGH